LKNFYKPYYIVGAVCAAVIVLLIKFDPEHRIVIKGSMTHGHEGMACEECHRPASGSMRQQLQAKASFILGTRSNDVDFITSAPTDSECQECHVRPNDRHPVYRFLEPRFAEARNAIHPESCMSCHKEHNGERVNVASVGADYCQHCHAETVVKNDPLEVAHADLIQQKQWTTCLQCHDFHGSHEYTLPASLKDTISLVSLMDYLKDGTSVYGTKNVEAPRELYTKKEPKP
jgi:hypothetical protein